MNETKRIPKFRSARRAVEWLKRERWNDGPNRLPADREEVFFKEDSDLKQQAHHVFAYSQYVGERLSPRFESILIHNHTCLLNYMKINLGKEDDLSLLENLKGDSQHLYHWAAWTGRRLPSHLEESIEEPYYALKYATEVVRGRLPEKMEKVFFKSAQHASEYAFEVIRGFSPIRLPDDLHAFMVMKSFESPNNSYIKEYMEACDDDPNKEGNHSV